MKIWKQFMNFQVNETSFDGVAQASKTQNGGESIILVDSLDDKNKELIVKVNLRQIILSHVLESYNSQLDKNTKINQDTKVLLVWIKKRISLKESLLKAQRK